MHEFECGHQECGARYRASSRDHLMQEVVEHLKGEHNVAQPTETLMTYLEATCVTESTGKSAT